MPDVARPSVTIPAAVAAERAAPVAPTPAAEAPDPAKAAVLVKHPATAVEAGEAAPAKAPAQDPSKRSSRKREGRTSSGDREQTKDEAAAAAAAAPTLPQRVTSQPVGRPNRAGRLSVDDF